MSNLIDMLLSQGDKLMERPKAEFEVSRLSKIIGQPFLITAHALTMREMDDLVGSENFREKIILAAVDDPDLRDARLSDMVKPKERKTPMTPLEVIRALLQPGEIINLYSKISELSGFSDAAVKEITKN